MKSTNILAATGALLALLSVPAFADVIVDYAMTANGASLVFNSSTNPATASPTVTASNVTATAIVNQAGATFSAANNFNGGTDAATQWNTAAGSTTSFANAFTAGSYITFNVTVAAGYQIQLSSISFQASSASTNASSDRAFYLVTATAPTSFTSSSTVLSTDRTVGGTLPLLSSTNAGTDTVPKDYSVSLTALEPVTSGTTQYFRFYLQTPTSSQGLFFDDIIVNGTVSAVPEPATCALFAGAALLATTLWRRRRP